MSGVPAPTYPWATFELKIRQFYNSTVHAILFGQTSEAWLVLQVHERHYEENEPLNLPQFAYELRMAALRKDEWDLMEDVS